ncbi:hypothetical protein H5410_001883 [Solanum commersonii]|uniref:Uncharacterized protein n=1 Tax=Solanum commersonii TaxID=4109 RepID=A0A9J6B0A9_SOLCO|nr:hypothetical protein H5410_001883 [Solanum commersonii]
MLDLSIMQSNFIRISIPPYVFVDTPSREKIDPHPKDLRTCLCCRENWKDLQKNSELKIMTPYDILFASALVSFLSNLKVLSVRCMELSKPALVILLGVRKFLTCMSDSCIMCQHTRNDEGFMRWYKYADLWKLDEVKSLAI